MVEAMVLGEQVKASSRMNWERNGVNDKEADGLEQAGICPWRLMVGAMALGEQVKASS